MSTTNPTNMNVDQIAAYYIQLRDKKAELVAQHKEQVAKYDATMAQIEGLLLTTMNGLGVQNMRTAAGTVYQSERFSATVEDFEALLQFVRTQGMWGLLIKRVSKEAVQQYLQDTQMLPPGVKATREYTVNIRRN